MSTRHFGSYTVARTHLRTLLDTARTGRVTTLTRDQETYSVIDAEVLRRQLLRLQPSHAAVVAEGGGWSALLPGLPVHGDGETLDDALDDLTEALREYAEDWNDHLLEAPNHRDNWPLVQLVELSTDEQLRVWILAGGGAAGTQPAPTAQQPGAGLR